MSQHHPLRPLLLSLVVALIGGTAVLGLPPLAGSPSIAAAAPVSAGAAEVSHEAAAPLPPQARPLPAALAVDAVPAVSDVAEVIRQQRAAGLDCELSAQGAPLCHHGEDAAPRQHHVAGSAGAGTPTSGQVGCYGTGADGPRVHAVYARPQGRPDRYASSVPSIRGWAAGISRQFDASAARTGGRRHVRFATTAGAGCTVTVLNVVLPDAAFRTFRATIDALQARGLDAPSGKYLVWADADGFCGLGTTFADDSPGLDNLNNGRYASYARVDRGCWGKVEAHELVHMLGGVQTSARNSTGGFHCNDGHDVMCYDDGTARSGQRSVCGKDGAALLDCRNDDYFSTAAPAGSYLQTRWNTARSSFLAAGLQDPAPAPKPAPSSPKPSAAPSSAPRPSSPTPAPSPSSTPAVDVRQLLAPLPLPTLPAVPVLPTPGVVTAVRG